VKRTWLQKELDRIQTATLILTADNEFLEARIEALQAEKEQLIAELDLINRKVLHGCIDMNCKECER